MGIGKLESQLSEINVTPMVDVMLVLLVIFMVTAPLMHREVDVQLPKAQGTKLTQSEEHLTVTVTKEGAIQLQNQAISVEELEKKLTSLQKDNKDAEVFLSADRRVNYGKVVEVIAAIKGAGITRLGMVTDPDAVKEGRKSAP